MFVSQKRKRIYSIVVLLMITALACSVSGTAGTDTAGGGSKPSVVVNSPADGTTVEVGQAVEVTSTSFASEGITKVELGINAQLFNTNVPPDGNPETYQAIQSWTPAVEGSVILSVVTFDTQGAASDPVLLTVIVVAPGQGGGQPAVPTDTVEAGQPTNTPPPPPPPPTDTNVPPPPPTNTNVPPPPTSTSTDLPLAAPPTSTPTLLVLQLPPIVVFQLAYTDFVYEQSNIPGNSTGNVSVQCPGDSIVTSGGYAASNGMYVYTQSMYNNGWRVYAKNNNGSSKLLNAYAVCLHNTSGSVTQVYAQITVAGNGNDNAVVSCPGGSIVVGGGYASKSDGTLWVYNSSKSGNGWQAYAHNSNGSGQLLNAYAICLSGVNATTDSVGNQGTVPGSGTKGVSKACSSGLNTGGGFAASTGLDIYNTSPADDNTWWTYARNTTGSSKLLNDYAICLTFN